MSEPDRVVYRRYYDLIAQHPGLTLSEYAKLTPHGSRYYSHLKRIVTNMEYYGYLLIEGSSGDLRPYKIIQRHPEDLHYDPISRDCRWRRTGTTLIREGPRSSRCHWPQIGRSVRWWRLAEI